jgi:hypothetical protein
MKMLGHVPTLNPTTLFSPKLKALFISQYGVPIDMPMQSIFLNVARCIVRYGIELKFVARSPQSCYG